jgi:hypothetical protein
MRVSLGFVPAWFYSRLGIDFSEVWHRDPHYRYHTLVKMKEYLAQIFPEASCWDLKSDEDCATISGCYGAFPIPFAFGVPLIYGNDSWPVPDPRQRLSLSQIEGLSIDSVLQSKAVEDIVHQMDIIEREWGIIHGYVNWQGVLNNAFNIRGPDIFLDLFDRPSFVQQFLSLITEVMIELGKVIQEKQRASGFYVNQMSVSNCVMNMLSPDTYEEFILPHDKRITGAFERFGVHTCNWNVTPYIESLKKLPKLGYLDMGIMSNLREVKAAFPHTRKAVIFSPVALNEASINDIWHDLKKIHREIAPCDVVMGDIQTNTPDSRVKELLSICKQLEMENREAQTD